MNVAQAVRDYLTEHGIKQTYLAQKCGWTRQKTSAIVLGKKKMTADEMAIICKAINVPYAFFYEITETSQSSA